MGMMGVIKELERKMEVAEMKMLRCFAWKDKGGQSKGCSATKGTRT